jgi:hypothetical protein
MMLYLQNESFRHIESLRQLSGRITTLTNRRNDFFIQFCHSMILALRLATPSDLVIHILLLCARIKMQATTAQAEIASMKHKKTVRNLAILQAKSYTVGLVANIHDAVASIPLFDDDAPVSLLDASKEGPAGICVFGFGNFSPETRLKISLAIVKRGTVQTAKDYMLSPWLKLIAAGGTNFGKIFRHSLRTSRARRIQEGPQDHKSFGLFALYDTFGWGNTR